jgi:hypothetical protein
LARHADGDPTDTGPGVEPGAQRPEGKRLDTKTTWESDVFPAPFSGHEGARQFFKVYLTAFPDLHLDIQQQDSHHFSTRDASAA